MTNRWIELMPPELRSQLSPSDLKSLGLLENVVADNEGSESLLKDEIERREIVSEEERLSRGQLMFCEYDYNREFQMERR